LQDGLDILDIGMFDDKLEFFGFTEFLLEVLLFGHNGEVLGFWVVLIPDVVELEDLERLAGRDAG
jgi:hypothetical protein